MPAQLPPARSSPDRAVFLILRAAMLVGLISTLGLAVDIVLVLTNYRLAQAALDGAALAAATAVDQRDANGVVTLELRLTQTADGLPSAYTLAQQYIDQYGNGRIAVTNIVADGQQMLAFGNVTSPTLFARLFGLSELSFGLVSSAELNPPSTPAGP